MQTLSYHPFSKAILSWYGQYGRDLPWRGLSDPYAIWLSEVILQQTRIDQGRDYWYRFMENYPTVEQLAAATEDEVLRLWQGLGYYSRARNLHAAARQVVAQGGFPTTLEGIRRLKGVGDYTAAAIASMAFGVPAAAVDGNVYRVLSRHFGIDIPINTTQGKKLFTSLAQDLLPKDEPAAFNQAMMDFGATQCTPRNAQCATCPVQGTCEALASRRVDRLPMKRKTVTVKTRRFHYVVVRCAGHMAMRRRPAGDIWQGLWEPLLVEGDTALPPMCGSEPVPVVGPVKHVLTHRIILADLSLLECASRPPLPEGYEWIAVSRLDHYALPRLVERLLEHLPLE